MASSRHRHANKSRQLVSANAHSLASHRSLKKYGATQQKRLNEHTTLTGISYNVRGLKHIYKLERLSHYIANNNIDFVCIQETWLSGSGPPKTVDTTTHKIPCKCTLFKHGPEKQEGRGSGGVVILLSPQGTKAWEKAGSPDPISVCTSEEIGWAMGLELHYEDREENILKYFIVTAYHPDSTKGTEIHEEFLETLADLYDKAPQDATIVSGEDINA